MIRRAALLALALSLAACGGQGGTPYERGAAAFESGDIRTARVELLNALQQEPGNKAARIMQARVQLALGDGEAAEGEINRARQSGATLGETSHLLAEARLRQGDAQGALREAANAGQPYFAYAQRIIGRAYMMLGDGSNASTAFDRALAAAPNDSDVWTDIAGFRRSNGDVAGALQAADRAVAARPRNAVALELRGELTRGQYGLAAAIPWFDRALEVDPGYVNALLERASTHADMGRMSDMLEDARKVNTLTGGHTRAYYLEAVLAARARDFELAKRLWVRTNGAYDDSPAGMLVLSAIDFQTGNQSLAAQRLSGLVQQQPTNRRARRLLAAAQWRMNDPAAVVATLRPIADRPDADAYSLSLIGRALSRTGDQNQAALYLARAALPQPGALAALDPLGDGEFAAARTAAEQSPDNGPAQLRYASALLARGQNGDALARARHLQQISPGAPEVYVLAGDIYGASGDFSAAAEQYRRAANLRFNEAVALRLIGALERSDQDDEADEVLSLFIQQNPASVPGLILVASDAMQQEDWPQAIQIYEGLRVRLGDNDATVLNNLAWAYAQTGDLGSAVPLARRAWSLDRDNPATADTLGWLLYRAGRRAEGLGLLQRAVRGAPSDAAIRQRLASARQG
ncbi:tetratricopeptide repeat protein [Allosphingosinicella sp.]|uniref:tetratricopeptide repeat protein n=1 Tax=Allosphingosinicella sp. TaxID=2823234 RepID=UPI0037830902